MTKKQICRRSTRRKPPGHTLPAVYAAAAKALAACVHVSDAEEICDQADAMVFYAKSAKTRRSSWKRPRPSSKRRRDVANCSSRWKKTGEPSQARPVAKEDRS